MTRQTERVPTVVRYLVRGILAFPVDMLRYDSCYPDSEMDSHVIEASIRHDTHGTTEVYVRSRHPLTVGRWESFGWKVVAVA